jgi:hypothetical protein
MFYRLRRTILSASFCLPCLGVVTIPGVSKSLEKILRDRLDHVRASHELLLPERVA